MSGGSAALKGLNPPESGMFPRRSLRGLRFRKSVAIEGLVFLHRGMEAERALPLAANDNADDLIGDFDRVTFRHSITLPANRHPHLCVPAQQG